MLKNLLKNNYLIILILLAVIVKELIFVVVIPLWQNHDELEHFAYTAYLAEEKKIPVYQGRFENHMDLTVSEEIKKADELLENNKISSAVFMKSQLIHQDFSRALSSQQVKSELSNLNRKINGQEYKNAAVLYSPLYYALEAIPYFIFYKDTIIARAFAMRIFGIIFLLITVIFSYKMARHILKSKLGAATVAVLIGFLPRFSYTSAGINNDALLITLSTIFLYLIIKYLSDKITLQNSIILGIVFGLGLLSKTQFIIFSPLLAGLYIYKFIKEKNNKYILQLALVALIILIISGWWFIFNYYHYHNLMGFGMETYGETNTANQLTFVKAISSIILRYFYLLNSYFYSFGCCGEILMAPFYQLIFCLTVGLFFLGFFLYLFKLKKDQSKTANRDEMIVMFSSFVLLEGLLFFLFLKGLIIKGNTSFPIDGRYYYPVISCLTILFIISLQKIIPDKYYKYTYLFLSTGIMILSTVSLIYNIIPRFYL